MGDAIGGTLPLAVGVAISPVPIIAVILMLTTQRARTNGPAFVLGWLVGLAIVGVIVLSIADPAGASESGNPSEGADWVIVGLGVLLLLVAAYQFRRRPRRGDEAPQPRWMAAVEKARPPAALVIGALMSGANPKNLLLAVSAAGVIAETGVPISKQAIAYAIFAIVSCIGVAAPVVIYFAKGDRSEQLLGNLKNWMGRHNAVIVAILCAIMGAKLIADAITSLPG